MTLAEIRAMVRRKIQDPETDPDTGTGVNWSNAELNAAINTIYADIQSQIHSVRPEEHLVYATFNLVANDPWYPLPQTFGVKRLELLQDDGSYLKIAKKDYDDINGQATTTSYWAREGQWLFIQPAPDAALTNGLRLIHVPIMQLSSESEVPKIRLPLHLGIVWGTVILLGEEDEAVDMVALENRYQRLLDRIPAWYNTDSDPMQFQVNH
jgi:hypothetical protein